jgi:hypothetical protein
MTQLLAQRRRIDEEDNCAGAPPQRLIFAMVLLPVGPQLEVRA